MHHDPRHCLPSTALALVALAQVTVSKTFEKEYYGMLSLPAFLVTDHERMYTLSFWAKSTSSAAGAAKPRPHVTFQDEDADYAWISGEHLQFSAFWHQVRTTHHHDQTKPSIARTPGPGLPCQDVPIRVTIAAAAAFGQYHVNLVVPYQLRGHNVVTNIMLGGYVGKSSSPLWPGTSPRSRVCVVARATEALRQPPLRCAQPLAARATHPSQGRSTLTTLR